MNFIGSEGPGSEVKLQAAMQNAGCECNYTGLEITQGCRVSIPGSAGQCACLVAG